MTHDYKAAQEELEQCFDMHGDWVPGSGLLLKRKMNTIIHAIRIADKLMQEPSDEVCVAFGESWFSKTRCIDDFGDDWFKAMRDQMLKEIEVKDMDALNLDE